MSTIFPRRLGLLLVVRPKTASTETTRNLLLSHVKGKMFSTKFRNTNINWTSIFKNISQPFKNAQSLVKTSAQRQAALGVQTVGKTGDYLRSKFPISQLKDVFSRSSLQVRYYNEAMRKLRQQWRFSPQDLAKIKGNPFGRWSALMGMLGLGTGFYYTEATPSPIIGRNRLCLVSREQLTRYAKKRANMVKKAWEDFEVKMRENPVKGMDQPKVLKDDHPAFQRCQRILQKIELYNEEVHVPYSDWNIVVIETDQVYQCTSFADGTIFISKNIVDHLAKDSELAFVIAHEMGHVVLDHHGEKFSMRYFLLHFLFHAVALIHNTWTDDEEKTKEVVKDLIKRFHKSITAILPDTNVFEYEADQVGLRLATRAKFDRNGYKEALLVLVREKPYFTIKFGHVLEVENSKKIWSMRDEKEDANEFRDFPNWIRDFIIHELPQYTMGHPTPHERIRSLATESARIFWEIDNEVEERRKKRAAAKEKKG